MSLAWRRSRPRASAKGSAILAIGAPAFIWAFAFALASPAGADSIEGFYRGRSLMVLIGHSAGGGYDLYARTLARFLGRHIPGQPVVVPQNMPGAGGLRLANYLYAAAPKDGSVIGTFSRSIPTLPLLAPPAAFDGTKFTWLGSMSGDTSLCLTGGKSPVKTWRDMLTMPAVMGGQSAGSDSDIYARLYKNVLGARIRLVTGYPGTNDITLAMERGEVDGICGLSWGTIKIAHPDWIRDARVNFLLQAGLKKDSELPDVPFTLDLVDDPEKKLVLYLYFAPQGMGRPFAAPPGIPADRRTALIKAFNDTLRDPELLAEAAREKMDIHPMASEEIDELLKELYATPAEVVAKAAKAISE
jgi:tripartite-type tricarboxylate transporter receptor subunit TctC